jgi:hypothetical protein
MHSNCPLGFWMIRSRKSMMPLKTLQRDSRTIIVNPNLCLE